MDGEGACVLVWREAERISAFYGRQIGVCCACVLILVSGFCWWWRSRLFRTRATCTRRLRWDRGASVRRRREVLWGGACVFCCMRRTSLFLRRGRGWGGRRGGLSGKSRTSRLRRTLAPLSHRSL